VLAIAVAAAGQDPARPAAKSFRATSPPVFRSTSHASACFSPLPTRRVASSPTSIRRFRSRRRQAATTISEFAAESDLPLRLGILIDTSNSVRDRFKFEQEAAGQFIDSVMRTNLDKALVVSFDTSAELVSDLISDTDKLNASIRDLRPGGGTALYDAIYFACRDKLSQDQPRYKFRRAIVVVSDGDDKPEPLHPRPGARKWRKRPTW